MHSRPLRAPQSGSDSGPAPVDCGAPLREARRVSSASGSANMSSGHLHRSSNEHAGGHGHAGHHHHGHAPLDPSRLNRAFAIGVVLNVAFVLVEGVAGFMADSLALLADAGHNLSDVMSLLLAWGAAALARLRPTPTRTYGYRRATIVASTLSSAALLAAVGAIAWEAIERLRSPAPVEGLTMILVAGIGVVINTATALLFARGREADLNVRAAFLHMAADAAVSVGVVLGGVGVLLAGWLWLDPAITLVIVAVILVTTWSLLRESLDLLFDAVPRSVNAREVLEYLEGQAGVAAVHDLHIWAMSTTETALTAHLVMPDGATDAFLQQLAAGLKARFRIEHTTLQVERGDGSVACAQACAPESAY